MMTTDRTADYEITARPAGSTFTCFACSRCCHEELGAPVFLRAVGAAESGAAYGSGCAALLLTGEKTAKAVRKVRNAQDEADRKASERAHREYLDSLPVFRTGRRCCPA